MYYLLNYLRGKSLLVASLGLLLSPAIHFIETYLYSDWQFLKFLLIVIAIDTCLGVWLSFKNHNVSSGKFSRLFNKLVLYLVFMVLTHILCHYTVEGAQNNLFGWFSSLAYSGIMVRESLSIVENLSALYPGLLPDWIMERLKNYEKTGNPDQIK